MIKIGNFKGLFSIGFAEIVGTGITVGFWFILASLIDPENYGEIFYYLGIAGTAAAIALVGTQNTLTVYIAKKIKIQSALYTISLIIAAISSIVIIIIFYRIDVGLVILGYVINTLAIGNLLGRKVFTQYSKYFLLQKVLTFILGIGFYFLFGIEGVIYALALSYIAYTITIYKGLRDSKQNFSLLKLHKVFIINNYALSVSNIAKSHVDKIIIPIILSFSILGNYALALQVIAVLHIFPNILFKFILPQDATGNTNYHLKKISIIIAIGIAVSGAIFLPIFIQEILPKYEDSIDAIRIMSFSLIPAMFVAVFSSRLLGLEKTKYLLIGSAINFSTIIIGAIVLGSMYNIQGLATSFLLANSFEAIILAVYSQRITNND